MRLRSLKLKYLDKKAQVIVFEKTGRILDSCHALSDISHLLNQSAYETYPLLDSMKEIIVAHTSSESPIRFPCVEFSLAGKEGFFDFELYTHPEDTSQVVWIIIDNTPLYAYYQKIQQERNLLLIEREDWRNGRSFNR